MASLAAERPVFHSEADFQHSLALMIHQLKPNLEVRLEIPVRGIALDMLVMDPTSGERLAVELKYKTALWEGSVGAEDFKLKNHGADDVGSYDVLKDVQRVEQLVTHGAASAGALIFLTNSSSYWNPRRPSARVTNAHEFRVSQGSTLHGVRSWGPNTGGSMRGRTEPITLTGVYVVDWEPYSNIGGKNGILKQLIFTV